MATVTPDYPRGITFEQYWASLMETKELFAKENARREKEAEQRQKEAELQRKEAELQRMELEKQMKETDRKIGELGNRFGELAEHLVAPGIVEKFNALGYHFDAVSPGGQEIRNE